MSLYIGQYNLGKALLPFLVALLIYFTSCKICMKVEIGKDDYKKSKNLFCKYIVYGKATLIKDRASNKYYKDMSDYITIVVCFV